MRLAEVELLRIAKVAVTKVLTVAESNVDFHIVATVTESGLRAEY